MRNFAKDLEQDVFWGADAEKVFDTVAVPAFDCCLQIRQEVAKFCDWIAEHHIQSYLELGIWTGHLTRILHRLFVFKSVAACDLELAKNYGFTPKLPTGCNYFYGNSLSPIYLNWRKKLGQVDLTVIDTDHTYESVKQNFEYSRQFGSKHIAIIGIASGIRGDGGPRAFWSELHGEKFEILQPHSEIGATESTIGIGIWTK